MRRPDYPNLKCRHSLRTGPQAESLQPWSAYKIEPWAAPGLRMPKTARAFAPSEEVSITLRSTPTNSPDVSRKERSQASGCNPLSVKFRTKRPQPYPNAPNSESEIHWPTTLKDLRSPPAPSLREFHQPLVSLIHMIQVESSDPSLSRHQSLIAFEQQWLRLGVSLLSR